MPLTGEYEPSPSQWVRDQVETYESSGGTEGTTMRGMPVVILTTMGSSSGKLRKVPLMRVVHEGVYAVVASLGGAPKHPVWYHNLLAEPRVELQDGPSKQDLVAREPVMRSRCGGIGPWPLSPTTPTTSARPAGRSPSSSSSLVTGLVPVHPQVRDTWCRHRKLPSGSLEQAAFSPPISAMWLTVFISGWS